ncbi:mechanosensitive ion channel family protein [Massilia sp. H6]|uniref:mechanosensitive ion channel family protein n=1 Tax=Massilia sp. H6 TaxID=2970464 RepID=UPI0021678898|nr:mechanosensitive ion channel family protein [Massilia sp. H6]UVW29902.1 mechanosensitive ion channel family protein [Massilia sp. H6]
MHYVILGYDLTAWTIAFGIGAAVCLLLYLAKGLVVRRLAVFAATTTTYLDDIAVKVLSATNPLFILSIGIVAGAQSLALSEPRATLLSRLAIAALLLQVARWGDIGVHAWLHYYRARRVGQDAASTTSTAAVGFVVRTVIWLVIILMILDNFGVNITTLVASLGIGGIAVALALQNILGDLFSSLSIVLDKPFEVGDFITVDDIAGTVEYVGLKTTRIRGLGGEQIIFSNSDLLKSRIRNFKRMQTRRIVFGIGVTYDTSKLQLRAIPEILREVVQAQPGVVFDRAHFKSFGDSSLDFETVYIMQTPEYGAYMDAQQAINMALFDRFASEGIEFAYPTQTLYLARQQKTDTP